MADIGVNIALSGFIPNTDIVIRAETRDDSYVRWESSVTIRVDENGRADLSTCRPLAGTYSEPDSMGLFWSMKPDPEAAKPSVFSKTGVEPINVTLSAMQDNEVVATATCQRLFVSPSTDVREIRERELVAKLFKPKKAGRYSGIMVMGGSGGGFAWSEQVAALLSSHGYAALALAYFHYEGLPPDLVDIPLEYFETAIQWMQEQDSIIPGKVAVSGISHGGELVLLLGSTYSTIRCVVAYVPSNAVMGSFTSDPKKQNHPSWTFRGKGIPRIKRKRKPAKLDETYTREPIPLTPRFLANYDFSAVREIKDGAIPVENTNGAVLMITGQDDQMWPSPMMADYVMDRLRRKGFKHVYQHLSYQGAGHYLKYPYLPSTVDQLTHNVSGVLYKVGGRGIDHHLAEVDSWNKTLEFLEGNYRYL